MQRVESELVRTACLQLDRRLIRAQLVAALCICTDLSIV